MNELPTKTQLDQLYFLTQKLSRYLQLQGYDCVCESERTLAHKFMNEHSAEGFHTEVSWPPLQASQIKDMLTEAESTSTPSQSKQR